MFITSLTTCCLDRNENPVHSLERMECTAPDLKRLDMELPPDFILSLYISALLHQDDVLKQHIGGRDVMKSETPGAIMGRHSELVAEEGTERTGHLYCQG